MILPQDCPGYMPKLCDDGDNSRVIAFGNAPILHMGYPVRFRRELVTYQEAHVIPMGPAVPLAYPVGFVSEWASFPCGYSYKT